MFDILIGIELRLKLISEGVGFWDRQRAMASYNRDMIPIAEGMCGVAVPAEYMAEPVVAGSVGALGDGTLWKRFKEWVKSPEGQAIIMALLSMLLMFI